MNAVLRRSSLNRTDFFVLLILLLAGIKYTDGLTHVLDVELYDESNYLRAGWLLPHLGLPSPEYAPLYAIWYYLLSLAQPDPVSLYYLGYALTTVLPPLFLYILLRVNRVPIVAGTIVAGYFLITQANFTTWPRPAHLALLIVVASMILAGRARRESTGWLLAAAGAMVASFARPEYFLAFLLLSAAGIARLVMEQRQAARARGWWLPLAAVGLLATLLLGGFGLPAFGKGGDRHFIAFAQHFAGNWGAWNHVDPAGPYKPATNFREITAKFFGDAGTVSEAARRNPGMFAKHIITNVRTLVPRFPGLFMHHENVLLPVGKNFDELEARLTLLGVIGFLYARRKRWLPGFGEKLRRHRQLLGSAALVCVPGLVSAVEIYPHDHYLLLPGTLIIAALTILCFEARDDPSPPLPLGRVLLLGLAVLAIVPALSHRPAIDTPIVRTIRAVQSLGIKGPVHLLDAEGGYDDYQTMNYHRVAEYDKHGPFHPFLLATGINLIVLTDRLSHDSHFADDPEWQSFLTHPEQAGFERRPVPDAPATLLIQRALLPPEPL